MTAIHDFGGFHDGSGPWQLPRVIPVCPWPLSRQGGADQPELGILHPEEQQAIVEAH